MAWDMEDDGDDWVMGRCRRCGHVHPVKVVNRSDISLDEEGDRYVPLKECGVCGWGGVQRNPIRGGYFKRDLLEAVEELPAMGKPCYHCGSRIPKFLDLGDELRHRLYELHRAGHDEEAIDALVAATGCPLEWARLWVTHPFGPRRPARLWVGPPCSRCGRPLRTRLARQCFECGLDWHGSGDPALV